MERRSIVSEICDTADDFLAGVAKREEAKAGIAEWLTIHRPSLAGDERHSIIKEVLSILEEEGFFAADAGAADEDIGDLPVMSE